MVSRQRVLLSVVLLVALVCAPASAGLLEYVAQPDRAYQWAKAGEQTVGACKVIDLTLTSQVWQGIPWKHTLRVVVPAEVKYPQAALLMITGGDPGAGDTMLGAIAARMMQAPIAILFNIPNQPLFGDKREDALIAYTFSKYLETGDETWPLLLPMTKSAVRAMDALQEFAKQEWQRDLTSFVVAGASKRGWTTWLTAAVDQKRVKGIVPMVIDMLNLPAQMRHQLEMWGAYSDEISEYTERGLQAMMATDKGPQLVKMVDPYSYRERLTMPKLIVNGANDPYWATDALNLYWEGLVGPKWVLYVPNAGHDLGDRAQVLRSAAAFFGAVAGGKSLPTMSWQHGDNGDRLTLTVTAAPRPLRARIWAARSQDLDFRNERWEATRMREQGDTFAGAVARPAGENIALFGEADFDGAAGAFTLSTQMRVVRKQ